MARRTLAVAAIATGLAASLTGCAGSGLSQADPLTPQADMARRSVPQPAQVPREFSKTLLPTYRLAPGDTVLVEPARFDTPLRFPADQPVQPDGTIDLGRFGRPPVAGLSVAEVEEVVARRIALVAERDEVLAEAIAEDPTAAEVNVRLIDPNGSVYYVLGAVQTPGVFQLAGRETVLDAILTAGGLTDNAKRCDIILARPSVPADCRTVLPVCYDHLVQMGDSTTNYQILPGDRIFVPSRGCKDTISEFFGCDDECDLCRCTPQFGCGPDAKPCPTPTRYAAMCPDRAGVSALDYPGPFGAEAAGLDELVAPPAPAPAVEDEGDFGPVPAPAPDPIDVPEVDPADAAPPAAPAPVTPAPETTEPPAAPAMPNNPAAPDAPAEETDPAPLPPEIPDLPDLDDLAVGRAALPPAPVWDSELPVLEVPANGF
ncbi:polysaccharide biosynthesis/export family protein [Alienimonas sp. DA493]|uniref:polysaccharide biosynthesis/export family protein n=1 Tax=Alienimonas sp. DA493 TaxID=3373605 RepID=UPI003754C1C1